MRTQQMWQMGTGKWGQPPFIIFKKSMDYQGVIIKESLDDKSVLKDVKILSIV